MLLIVWLLSVFHQIWDVVPRYLHIVFSLYQRWLPLDVQEHTKKQEQRAFTGFFPFRMLLLTDAVKIPCSGNNRETLEQIELNEG